MRVVFVGFPLVHYFRDFLNRLEARPEVTVLHVKPERPERFVGAGVFQDEGGLSFGSEELPVRWIEERRLFGASDFQLRPAYHLLEKLPEFLERERPDIAVIHNDFHSMFMYEAPLRRTVRRLNIKVVFNDIPFRLPTYQEALSGLPTVSRLPLRSSRAARIAAHALRIDKLYARMIRNPAIRRPVEQKRKLLRQPDAHSVYHDGGVAVYETYGVSREKVFVLRNSPDTSKLMMMVDAVGTYPPLLPDNPKRIVHIGRLVEWKRVDMLIHALAALRDGPHPNAELVIIGSGPEESKLKSFCRSLGLTECVHFAGGVYDPTLLARYLTASSVYVLAGMGGVSINEAMACGLPVVCSRCDGTEEFLVRDGVNGLRFREGDLHDLTAKLSWAFDHPEALRTMGARSREIIEREININIFVDNYMAMFKHLMNGKAARREIVQQNQECFE